MAGVCSTARRPLEECTEEATNKRARSVRHDDEALETMELMKELFGTDISEADLLKVGDSERAARLAIMMLAGGGHDIDDPVFAAKVDEVVADKEIAS